MIVIIIMTVIIIVIIIMRMIIIIIIIIINIVTIVGIVIVIIWPNTESNNAAGYNETLYLFYILLIKNIHILSSCYDYVLLSLLW